MPQARLAAQFCGDEGKLGYASKYLLKDEMLMLSLTNVYELGSPL